MKIDEETALAAGGQGRYGGFPKTTHFLSLMDMTWSSNGPEVLMGRYYHSCGLIESSADSGVRYNSYNIVNQLHFRSTFYFLLSVML